MSLIDVLEDAPFRSAESALRFSYNTEARDCVKISSYLRDLRGGSVKSRSSDGPFDIHAQAAMIIALAERSLPDRQLIAIRAYYTMPNQKDLEDRKQNDCMILAELVRDGQSMIPFWYAVDCIREWSRLRRHHTDTWWSKRLNIHSRQLSRYHLGARNKGFVGVLPFVNELFALAIDKMTSLMQERGLIP